MNLVAVGTESKSNFEEQNKSLERLIVGNTDLEKLEKLLDQFNIFEAIGMVRQEIRHSHFLAFLLDPQQKHGLGSTFIKQLLQKVLASADNASLPVTPIDLDLWSLDQCVVLREWQNIDILLLDSTNKFIVIIENKIDTTEHSNQLERYWERVNTRYSQELGWKIVGLYLTREGELPQEGAERYLPVSYKVVSDVMEDLAQRRASTLGAEVSTLMLHYTQMLRRHIVSESEIANLCQRVYQKHKQALDLIFEYRLDQQSTISELIGNLVKAESNLELDRAGKTSIKFAVKEWDEIPALKGAANWSLRGRVLLFEFDNREKSLNLKLYIGPRPGDTHVRQQLFDIAKSHPPIFRAANLRLAAKWNRIYNRSILTEKDYEESTAEEREEKIRQQWETFLSDDLPKIRKVIETEKHKFALPVTA